MATTEYLVLLFGDESVWEQASPQEREEIFAAHGAFTEQCGARGHEITGGAELAHSRTARTVRRGDDGRTTVTDGPFAEAVEQIGGFYQVRTADVDDLLALVAAHLGDGAEVRPVVAYEPEEADADAAAASTASVP